MIYSVKPTKVLSYDTEVKHIQEALNNYIDELPSQEYEIALLQCIEFIKEHILYDSSINYILIFDEERDRWYLDYANQD